jgi:hypothetical protein
MDAETTEPRKHTIAKILFKQDDAFRWGFDEEQALERPKSRRNQQMATHPPKQQAPKPKRSVKGR